VKIVLDTTILVRANDRSNGLARDLLMHIVESNHTLVLSNEMLHELAKVLRYPRLRKYFGLSEKRIYDYVGFLREISEIVELNPLLTTPIRDVNDIIVMQTAILGEADTLCTTDDDFFEEPARPFLDRLGIIVLDDISLIHRLRS
jgi:putative PIN family toxin of toxin-antitoxin system